MKLLLILTLTGLALGADWDALRRIPAGQKLEITTLDGVRSRGTFVSGDAAAIVLHDTTGERSVPRTQVREVRLYDPGRRVRFGLLWTLVGAGAGVGIGAAICPYCPNEGHGAKFIGPGAAIGAGVGALGFFSSPYRRIYKTR